MMRSAPNLVLPNENSDTSVLPTSLQDYQLGSLSPSSRPRELSAACPVDTEFECQSAEEFWQEIHTILTIPSDFDAFNNLQVNHLLLCYIKLIHTYKDSFASSKDELARCAYYLVAADVFKSARVFCIRRLLNLVKNETVPMLADLDVKFLLLAALLLAAKLYDDARAVMHAYKGFYVGVYVLWESNCSLRVAGVGKGPVGPVGPVEAVGTVGNVRPVGTVSGASNDPESYSKYGFSSEISTSSGSNTTLASSSGSITADSTDSASFSPVLQATDPAKYTRIHQYLCELLYQICLVARLDSDELLYFDDALVAQLFDLLGTPAAGDSLCYAIVKLLLVLNEQYMIFQHRNREGSESREDTENRETTGIRDNLSVPSADPTTAQGTNLPNRVFECLRTRGRQLRSFGEKLILFLNREEDFCVEILSLKLLYLMFSHPSTAEFFYLNDLRVLVDVFIRTLNDVADEAVQETFLRALYPLLRNTQLARHPYKARQLAKLLRSLQTAPNCSEVISRLTARCLAVPWLPPPKPKPVAQQSFETALTDSKDVADTAESGELAETAESIESVETTETSELSETSEASETSSIASSTLSLSTAEDGGALRRELSATSLESGEMYRYASLTAVNAARKVRSDEGTPDPPGRFGWSPCGPSGARHGSIRPPVPVPRHRVTRTLSVPNSPSSCAVSRSSRLGPPPPTPPSRKAPGRKHSYSSPDAYSLETATGEAEMSERRFRPPPPPPPVLLQSASSVYEMPSLQRIMEEETTDRLRKKERYFGSESALDLRVYK